MNAPINEDNNMPESQVFMLRFWLEDLGSGQKEWRGKAQYINKGEVIYFRDWSNLETFIGGFLSGCIDEEAHMDSFDKQHKGRSQGKGKVC